MLGGVVDGAVGDLIDGVGVDRNPGRHVNLGSDVAGSEFREFVRSLAGEVVVIMCSNGGSASTASHYITDWAKMLNVATNEKFRGVSLVDNVGLMTAYCNDPSYEEVFSGQGKALLDEGDLLIAVSGNSPNILSALRQANEMGAHTLGIFGYYGGEAAKIAHHSFIVPSFDMQVCEDINLMFGHMVMKTYCQLDIRGVV